MTRAFDSIKQGLSEAIAHAQTKGKKPVGMRVENSQHLQAQKTRLEPAVAEQLKPLNKHTQES